MIKSETQNETPLQKLKSLLFFSFSDKLKFSIKVSLSMALAYLIPLSQGWAQASTAAITVMLIAAMGSVGESVSKGAMRVVGTIIGAIIGMTLIALFPQERVLYLISLSIAVAIPLYLVRAYKGDPSVFMLTAMTMMLVFKNGEVDDVFLYGLDKTYMTIFGITVYTLVGVFLWPVNVEDTTTQHAVALTKAQKALFENIDSPKEEREKSVATLLESETGLESAMVDADTSLITKKEWHSIKQSYKSISRELMLLAMQDKEIHLSDIENYVSGYGAVHDEIERLFEDIQTVWESHKRIKLAEKIELVHHSDQIVSLSHLQRASLIARVQDMKKLYDALVKLTEKLNSIHTPKPTFFTKEELPTNSAFLWGNIEHLKGALITFMVFWAAVYFWVMTNPPGGFMVVVLATGLSVFTTFTPVKPSMLIIVFTLSFIFATVMYVAVLPNLRYGWELGVFIFIYTFISFHLLNPKLSIFFLLGLFTFGIANEMNYNFSMFLLLLLVFYSFLTLLHIFYYVPFSTRPEHMLLRMKDRFFILASKMLEHGRLLHTRKSTLGVKFMGTYSALHLQPTLKQMEVWSNTLDADYFSGVDKQKLLSFTKTSEKFAYLVGLLYHKELKMVDNPLLKQLAQSYTPPYFSDLLKAYANGKNVHKTDELWKDTKAIEESVEEKLLKVFEEIDLEQYTKEDIASLYEVLALRRSVWLAFFESQKRMEEIDFNVLKQSRF